MKKILIWKTKLIKGLIKLVLNVALCLIILLVLLVTLVQLPASQHYLINKSNAYLSEKLGFQITVDGVYIDWFDEIALVGVHCTDPQGGKMVYLDEAEVDFTIVSLMKGKFNIDNIELTNGEVNLVRYVGSPDINFAQLIWNIQDLTAPVSPDPNRKPVPFDIGRFTINNMKFSYHDKREPFIEGDMFDHNHFTLDSIYGLVSGFRAILDTVELKARHLQLDLVESHIHLHELTTNFRLTKKSIECADLYARVGNTFITDYLKFSFDSMACLSDFNNQVDLYIRLKNSQAFLKDIAHFAPALREYNDTWKLNGVVHGRINRLYVDSLDARFGNYARVKGDLRFRGLPTISETFLDIGLRDVNVTSGDLKQYTGPIAEDFLFKFGQIRGEGALIGFPNDFVARGKFNTGLGYFDTDVNIKLDEKDKNASTYTGDLSTKGFDVGTFLGYSIFGKMDMKGKVEGEGFTLARSHIILDAEFERLGLMGYDYKNIITKAEIKDKFFNGSISVADTNLQMYADGKIDLSVSGNEEFEIRGDLKHSDLQAIGLSSVPAQFSTKFDMNFAGTELDKIMGDALLLHSKLTMEEKELKLSFTQLLVSKNNDNRYMKFTSDFFNATLNGPFEITHLLEDLPRLYKEYMLFVSNEKRYIDDYYKKRGAISQKKYKLDYEFKLKNINPLLDMFLPGTYLSDNAHIDGTFISGYTSILNAFASFDTLVYKGQEIRKGQLDLSTSKLTDSSNVLAAFMFSSQSQQFTSMVPTENLLLEGTWDKNKINFTSGIKQSKDDNRLQLNGDLLFQQDGKLLHLRGSYASILGKKWTVLDSNAIYFNNEMVKFDNFHLHFENQELDLSGTFSRKKDEVAKLIIHNFNLNNLNPILSYKLNGIVDGNVAFHDIFDHLDIQGNITVDSFVVDQFYIGDISGHTNWDNTAKAIGVGMNVKRDGSVIISTFGSIKPASEGSKDHVYLVANLKDADIRILSPILSGVMSDLKGEATGRLTVTGPINDINVKGEVEIQRGSFRFDYLGTHYLVDDKIYFEEGAIRFKKMKLRDAKGNVGTLNGGIYHDGFKNFLVDIKGSFKDFQVLNTGEKDNEMYYGQAYASGTVNILGPFEHLKITADMTSEKGTNVFVPIGATGDVAQSEFIIWGNKEIKKIEDSLKASSVEVDLMMTLTPDANVEIIFDKQAGDIIKANGSGHIRMVIDTRGDFSMYGGLTIKQGQYNFTMAGIINKAFKIDNGSTIAWTGDPYEGVLDIKARHELNASLKPLIEDTTLLRSPDLQKTYPTSVLLGVRGALMHPEITLGCELRQYPQNPAINTVVVNYMSTLKTNDQELNKQVFSLIMFKRFSSPNSFSGGGVGGGATLSELFSNQLSSVLSQVDENLEVNVNLRNVDKDALNSMQLRFSYTALDGRLRISREGSFQNVQNSQQANVSNIAGEWTVEYLVSEDGKLRLKLFNKIQNNGIVTSLNNTTNTSAGFSVLHTQGFNTLGDLFNGKQRRKKKEQERKENALIINLEEQKDSLEHATNPQDTTDNKSDPKPAPID